MMRRSRLMFSFWFAKGRFMRRWWIVTPLCLLLLFVPIYLWQIVGGPGGGSIPAPPNKDLLKKPFDPLDTGSFERGIVAGATNLDEISRYALTDPVELLRLSLVKYQESTKGYACTLCKHERINGKLNPPEVIEAWFKEEPFSVFMHWTQGGGPACASLYVQGENKNKVCIRPSLVAGKLFGYVERAPDASDVKDNTRYLITEFGLRCGTERTYKTWKELRDKGVILDTHYLGLQTNVPEAGGRACHVIKRICNPPEEEGLTEVTVYIDAETWFQVGSVLKANDDLIGSYWFKDIKLNPTFDDKQFRPETLKKY
jgi:hypothetical protein